jgi:uncharacterized protein
MLSCMTDAAHDTEHVYRVLNYALDIARHEPEADVDLLTAACLLHDIGRAEQFADPSVDHAACGAEKARRWLAANGRSERFSAEAGECIRTHRFRSDSPPRSVEAKILFDADKLEACGAMGIARTLAYKALVAEPLYALAGPGEVSDGTSGGERSFLHEYKFKLEKLYDMFYTERGAELAAKRKAAAGDFYAALLAEARECYSV